MPHHRSPLCAHNGGEEGLERRAQGLRVNTDAPILAVLAQRPWAAHSPAATGQELMARPGERRCTCCSSFLWGDWTPTHTASHLRAGPSHSLPSPSQWPGCHDLAGTKGGDRVLDAPNASSTQPWLPGV